MLSLTIIYVYAGVETEVTKCTKLINTAYENIMNGVTARKNALLEKLKGISSEKVAKLDKVYEQLKTDSGLTSSVM